MATRRPPCIGRRRAIPTADTCRSGPTIRRRRWSPPRRSATGSRGCRASRPLPLTVSSKEQLLRLPVGIQAGDEFAIAVVDLGRDAVLAAQRLLRRLAPARMIDRRIDVG